MTSQAAKTGAYGEWVSRAYVTELGWHIHTNNYRCRYGEIDIIATTPDQGLVFIEVKSYKPNAMVSGLSAITKAKQKRLVITIHHFLSTSSLDFDPAWMRVDILLATPAVVLEHLTNCIGPEVWVP